MSLPEDTPPVERDFVELATRRLADRPELREAAQIELLGQLSRTDPATRGEAVAAAAARLAKSAPGRGHTLMRWSAVLWVLLAGIIAWQAFAFWREGRPVKIELRKFPHTLAERRDFKEPADLEDYLIGEGRMPPDFREIWTRIDPDNGAWPWLEAQSIAERMYNDAHSKRKMTRSPGWPDEEFSRAWRLVEQAVEAPRFEWYFPERRAVRQVAAGAGRTVLSIGSQAAAERFQDPQFIWSLCAEELFAESALRLVVAKDRVGLKRAIRLWEKLIVRTGLEVKTRDDLVTLGALTAPNYQVANAFLDAVYDLWPGLDTTAMPRRGGPNDVTSVLRLGFGYGDELARPSLWNWERFLKSGHSAMAPERGYLAERIGLFGQAIADYEPGRLAEYAMAERLAATVAAALLLVVTLAVWLKALCRESRIVAAAEGLLPLLGRRDWLWLTGLGGLAPLAWYWGITRLTPLGCREEGGAGLLILVQTVATLLLVFTMIEQAVRRRVSRRMAVLSLSNRRLWPGWTLAILFAIAIPVAGLLRKHFGESFNDYPVFVLMGLCGVLLPMLCKGMEMLLPLGRSALLGTMLCRTALPLLVFLVGILAGSHAILLARERSLLARDPLTGWDAGRGTLRYHARQIEKVNALSYEFWQRGGSEQQSFNLPAD